MTKYRPDIQGLRAIAVIAVIVFHLDPALLPGGFVGVDIFLVISGFLIASILLNKKEQADYKPAATLKYFYKSRFKRLAPAYFVTLIIVSLFAAVLFLPADFETYTDGLEKAAYFNSNNHFANFGDYFAPASYEQPLLHTWSLAVEVQFYLIAPFIFLLLPRRVLSWLLPLSIIVLTAYTEYQLRIWGQEQATCYSLSARLPAFFMGAWIALLIGNTNNEEKQSRFNPYLVWLSSVLILTSFWLPKMTGYFPGVAGLIPTIGAALLILNRSNSVISKLLSSNLLVWLGTLSYSLYLWHWPVLALIRYYTGAELLSLQYNIAFIALTLVLAITSYYWIETPLRQKRSKKQIIGYASLAVVILFTVAGVKKINAFYTPESLPIEYTRYADPKTICHGNIVGNCLKGDLTSDKEILVLGDSHAAMLNHFFDYLGKELNFKARVITASSCLTIDGFDIHYIADWARKDCLDQIAEAGRHVNTAESIVLAGMWSYQLISHQNVKAITQFLDKYPEKQMAVLPQVPELRLSPLRYNRFQEIGLNYMQGFTHGWFIYDQVIKNLVANCINCSLLPNNSFKALGDLPYNQHELLYFDNSHLNELGSQRYAEIMKPLILKWLDQKND